MTLRVWAAGSVALLALGLAVARVPAAIRTAYTQVTQPRGSLVQRDLEPLYTPQPFLLQIATAAMQYIPRNATYSVVVGNGPQVGDLVKDGLAPLLWYALLPRRYTPTLPQAQYVITFEHSPDDLGVSVNRVRALGQYAEVAEVVK
jgi:hypothetical protein